MATHSAQPGGVAPASDDATPTAKPTPASATSTAYLVVGIVLLVVAGIIWGISLGEAQSTVESYGGGLYPDTPERTVVEPGANPAGGYFAASLFLVAGSVLASIAVIAKGVSLGNHESR